MATATKAPAKKVAAAKKAAVSKKAAAPVKKAASKTAGVEGADRHELKPTGMEADVVRLRKEDGLKWDEIADKMGTTTGRVLMAWNIATVGNKRIKGTQEERASHIVRLREELHSWGQIAAIVNLNEGFVRSEYHRLTGTPTRGLRVGRGGKYPNDMPDSERPVKAAKPAPQRKVKQEATGKTALVDLDLDGLKEALTQRAIQVNRDGAAPEMVKVKEVKSLAKGTVTLTNEKGSSRTIKVANIGKVSKQKVAI